MRDRQRQIGLGTRLKQLREETKLSQSELARKATVNQSLISQVEAGKKPLPMKHLEPLAHALGVSPAELVGGVTSDDVLGSLLPAWRDYDQTRDSYAWLRDQVAPMSRIIKRFERQLLDLIDKCSDETARRISGVPPGHESKARSVLRGRIERFGSWGFRTEISDRMPRQKEEHAAYRSVPVDTRDKQRLTMLMPIFHTLDQASDDDIALLGRLAHRFASSPSYKGSARPLGGRSEGESNDQ